MAWVVTNHDDFDPEFDALPEEVQNELLVAGDKSGIGQRRFYAGLVRKVDSRFGVHLKMLKES